MNSTRANEGDLHLGETARRPMMIAGAVGVIGIVASVLLYLPSDMLPGRFFRAYLTAYLLVLGISLWGLLFCMIQHATRAGWSATVRRIAEMLASNLTWLWVPFIPIAAAMLWSKQTHLYEWAIPAVVAEDQVLQGKEAYLNPAFWLIRAAIFFIIWAVLARIFVGESTAQDHDGDVEHTRRMERFAPVGCLLFALSITFAAFDWIMSLEPHWFSTIFGVYFFAASSAAFLSVTILIAYFVQRAGKAREHFTIEHYHDLGKLLFAFGVVFWAYIAFSQFMLIWYANIPEETTFFLIRGVGGWYGVSLVLVLGHFAAPFVLLVSRHPKRKRQLIAAVAGWMLLMALVDFYWLTVPSVPIDLLESSPSHEAFVAAFQTETIPAEVAAERGLDPEAGWTWMGVYGFHPHLLDLTWAIGLLGLLVFGTLRTMSRHALVPLHDPRLDEALAFENF